MNKKIIVDVFGSDSPSELIRGCADCINQTDGVTLMLSGSRTYIESELVKYDFDRARVEILDAPEVITNDESPTAAIMRKRSSSLVVALKELRANDDAVGMIAAGSTGALLCGSAAFAGRLPGVVFPALATFLPTKSGRYACMLDCGANVDAKPEQMRQFAMMGVALMQSCEGIESPRVAVVSVGTEDAKGSEFSKKVYGYLSDMPINFVGNMEARDALSGNYDVMVCDGFTGNVMLKSIEGTAMFVLEAFMRNIKQCTPDGTDTSFIKKALGGVMNEIDFSSVGGAMLLGVSKPIIKAHGNSNAKTIPNVVRQLQRITDGGYIEKTAELLAKIK